MICGPVISTNDLTAQVSLYTECFGLQPPLKRTIDATEAAKLCGRGGLQFDTAWLAAGAGPFGVRLWSFHGANTNTVRSADRGTDRDAPKVIDFYAPDFDAAIQHLAGKGRNVKSSIAEYALPEGIMREAHLWGPDNVVSAVISGPQDFFERFATIRDKMFSEPQSISTPVSDLKAAIGFYGAVFGLMPVYEYEFENTSFDALVGSDTVIKLRAVNIGTSTDQPYVGLIDYGNAVQSGWSLKGKTRPPARGLLGVEVLVDNLEQTLANAEKCEGVTILGAPAVMEYPPYGATVSGTIEAPHGVLHHVVQRMKR